MERVRLKVQTAALQRTFCCVKKDIETGCAFSFYPEPYLTLEQDENDEDGAGLFHARVLLAEAEPKSAKRIKEMLEEAGYMVTVEGDGKQVIKLQRTPSRRGWRPFRCKAPDREGGCVHD